ncbi:MAG: MFS transporter [Chitinivibrionales bacterium]|nr:MFS transporter [Chitinivibrionales bacterium]
MSRSSGTAVLPASALGAAQQDSAGAKAFQYFLLLTALHGVLGRLVGYFLPIYFKELGFSGVQTGVYFTIASISTLVLSLPMGISTDRFSIARIFMLSGLLMSISFLGFIFTRSYWVFCAFAFLGSFGGRFHGTARSSLFFKIAGQDDGRRAGLYQLINFSSTGVGMMIGALIIAGASYRTMFVAACIGNLLIAGLSYFLPRTDTVAIKFAEYQRDIFTPRVLFITAIFTLSSLHWGAEMVAYGPFLKEDLGLTVRQTGLYTATGFVFVGLGAYLGVILLRRGIMRDLQGILHLGFILAGVFHILMVVRNPWLSFGLRLVHEIGDGLVFLAFYNGIGKIFHINKIGGCAAFISLCMGLGGMGSSILFGWVGDAFGYQWPLILSGAVMVLLPALLAMSRHKLEEKPA